MATVTDIPILNIVSDEEADEDDEEKDANEGSSDHRMDDSSSSSDKGGSNGTEDEEEEEGEDEEGDGFEIRLVQIMLSLSWRVAVLLRIMRLFLRLRRSMMPHLLIVIKHQI